MKCLYLHKKYTYIIINKHIHSLLLKMQVVQPGPDVSLVVILSLVELFDVIVVTDDDEVELLTTPDINSDVSMIAVTRERQTSSKHERKTKNDKQ